MGPREGGPKSEGAGGGLFGRLGQRRGSDGLAAAGIADGSAFYFDPQRHDFGDKTLLGHSIVGGGAAEVEQALDLLARHPSTANHLSYKLAQYFVADEPPPALVSRMARRYQETDGDIRELLTTMFASAEFRDRRCFRAKFKTPMEYVISTVRATGAAVENFRPLAGMIALLGMPLYGCQTPNGYSNTQIAWLNPDAMMARLSFATGLGHGNLPLEQPQSDENADGENGGEMRGDAGYFNRAGKSNVKLIADPETPAQKMEPPDPLELAATAGNSFSVSTRDAIESAPPQLRAALMLGSPEFMMR